MMAGGTQQPWPHVERPSLEARSHLWTREEPEEGGDQSRGLAGGGNAPSRVLRGGGKAGGEWSGDPSRLGGGPAYLRAAPPHRAQLLSLPPAATHPQDEAGLDEVCRGRWGRRGVGTMAVVEGYIGELTRVNPGVADIQPIVVTPSQDPHRC